MGAKRKAVEDLSTNKHTTKARDRRERMTPIELEVEKAKNGDQAAITYAKKKLMSDPAFKAASAEHQARLIADSKETVEKKRISEGKHASVVAERLHGDDQFENVRFTFKEDVESFENMWREDDKANGMLEDPVEPTNIVSLTEKLDLICTSVETVEGSLFKYKLDDIEKLGWKAILQDALDKTSEECSSFILSQIDMYVPPGDLARWVRSQPRLYRKGIMNRMGRRLVKKVSTRVIKNIQTPYEYFNEFERILWQAEKAKQDEEWVELPGPADWWTNGGEWMFTARENDEFEI